MAKKNKLKITQIKSSIGYRIKSRNTLEALGLKKMNQSVIHNDVPSIRGMINSIPFLISVEEL
tara:strand:+ start:260 stop:448 length:189 start_codon:yes stop_codon:yes gene_type:complete